MSFHFLGINYDETYIAEYFNAKNRKHDCFSQQLCALYFKAVLSIFKSIKTIFTIYILT